MSNLPVIHKSFYRAWVWANGWSELVGLGSAALLAVLMNRVLGNSPSAWAMVINAAASVLAGILLEGALVGYAQGRVLQSALPSLSIRRWTLWTAMGAGIAWVLGMIPSILISLRSPSAGADKPPFEGPEIFAAAALMGIALGPFLAVPQWIELRKHVKRAGWWIAANSAAWAVGMVIVFVGATAPSETTSLSIIVSTIIVTCLAAGLTVGTLQGLFLLWLIRPPADWMKQEGAVTA